MPTTRKTPGQIIREVHPIAAAIRRAVARATAKPARPVNKPARKARQTPAAKRRTPKR